MVHWITDVPGTCNFRDLCTGSFPGHLVYRSADLSHFPSSSLPALSQYVDTVIDLRSIPEVRRNGTVGPSHDSVTDEEMLRHGIRRLHAPIFDELEYTPETIADRHALYQTGEEGFVSAYRGILNHSGPSLRTLFHCLASKEREEKGRRKGILIHCSAGKDRTGVLCAILLMLANIHTHEIAQEYGLSQIGLAERYQELMARLGPHASLQDKEKIDVMMSSDAQVMLRTVRMIDEEYGGVEALCRRSVEGRDFEAVKRMVCASEIKL